MAKSHRDLVDEQACVLVSQIHSDIIDIIHTSKKRSEALEQLRMKARDTLDFMLTEMEIFKKGRDGR
jgi:hypothetical protein